MKKKILVGTPIVLLALAAATFVYVRSAYPPERLLELLEPRIEAALGRDVSIRGARLTPFPLAVRLEEIRVAGASGSETPLLEIGALRFDLQWLALLRRQIAVRSLVLESPRVFLERTADGRWNYATSEASTPGGTSRARGATPDTPLGIRVESLRLQHGALRIRDAVTDVSCDVPLEAELLLSLDRALRDVQVRGWLEADGVSGGEGRLAAVRDLRLRVEPQVRASLADSSAVIDALRVELAGLTLELEGRAAVKNGTPALQLRTRSEEFELAEIMSLVPVELAPAVDKVEARGTGKLSLQVDQAPGETARFTGRLTLADGLLRHPDWPAPVRELHAEIDWADQVVTIRRIEARVADSPLRVSGQMQQPLDPENARFDLDVEATLDLQKIAPILAPPPDVAIEGQLAAKVHARGAMRGGALPEITGPITLQGVGVRTPDLAGAIRIDATLQGAGDVVRIETGSVAVGDDRIAVEGELTLALPPELPRVVLRGRTRKIDLDALKPPTAPGAVAAAGRGQDAGAATQALLPKLPAARFDVSLNADDARVQQATLRTMHTELRGDSERFELVMRAKSLERETLRLVNVEARLAGTSDAAAGELRATQGVLGKIGVEALRSDVRVEGTRIELPNLRGDAYAGRVQGKAVLDVADPTAPRQDIDVNIEEVQLGGLLGDLWSVGGMVAGSVSGSTQLVLQGSDPDAIRKTLSAAGNGIAVNGRLRDMPLLSQLGEWLQIPTLGNLNYRELGFDFTVDSGRVRFPRVQLMAQEVAIGVIGSVGLDGSLDLDVNVQLSEASTRSSLQGPLAARVGSLFTDGQGHLVFDFDVVGTFRAPKLQPNLERTAASRGMKSIGQQDIRRLLGGIAAELGATPQGEDTVGKQVKGAVQSGVKGAIGGLLGKKKPTAAADSTHKP